MRVLVVNAGSSSLKLSLLDQHDRTVWAESFGAVRGRLDDDAVRSRVAALHAVDAVGHRVVHGGVEFVEPVLLDADVLARLRALTDLAPLHQPKSLQGIELLDRVLPGVPAVACFDTAFHAQLDAAAATYALPREWRTRWPLRRFGFHGLSHAYASRRAAELAGRPLVELRVVSCHLGAGASLAAVAGGRSVDTTMGFTPLEGLVMATRSGSLDPGLVLWLEEHVRMPPAELAATLEHRSGLLGLAGSDDMRAVLAAEASGDPDAALAIGVYLHRLRAAVAAMAAATGGLDVLVFTGGIGERSPDIRRRTAEGLAFLGVAVEDDGADPDVELTAAGADVRTFAVAAREDVEIARGVRAVLR